MDEGNNAHIGEKEEEVLSLESTDHTTRRNRSAEGMLEIMHCCLITHAAHDHSAITT